MLLQSRPLPAACSDQTPLHPWHPALQGLAVIVVVVFVVAFVASVAILAFFPTVKCEVVRFIVCPSSVHLRPFSVFLFPSQQQPAAALYLRARKNKVRAPSL